MTVLVPALAAAHLSSALLILGFGGLGGFGARGVGGTAGVVIVVAMMGLRLYMRSRGGGRGGRRGPWW